MKKFPAIVYCMCQQGMTSEQLANKVDMRQSTFSRKLNGRTIVSPGWRLMRWRF